MSDDAHVSTNRLAGSASPYLRQHAHNPVDWFPWGPEAHEKARREDKPIFLSVGYAACHWCHVMAHESFEDPAVAAVLNEHFVSIKVDREERPDVDAAYMHAALLMTGQGGWPLTVFLTPELEPFFAGTYFPPEDRFGRPGFRRLAEHLATAWQTRRAEIAAHADEFAEAMRAQLTPPKPGGVAFGEVEDALTRHWRATYDAEHGGFGGAPKFPPCPALRLLLRLGHGRDNGLHGMALDTLRKMARGGIYDHLGGGFHRYAVDAAWRVPHFEKMLYDNAQLARLLIEANQVSGEALFRARAVETVEYVLRDLASPEGGFCSSEDADSEGQEGAFYTWTEAEARAVLGDDAPRFCKAYAVLPEGNFEAHEPYHENQNILRLTEPFEAEGPMAEARARLFEARARRPRPGRDDKIVTAWNGVMIAALAEAGQVFDAPRYIEAAHDAARFVLDKLQAGGRLLRSYCRGVPGDAGYLDDYACLADGLASLYEAAFDTAWLDRAETLADAMIARFGDREHGGFFYTDAAHGPQIARTKPLIDDALPAANAAAARALLRLARLLGRDDYRAQAESTLALAAQGFERYPQALCGMAEALYMAETQGIEVAVVGPAEAPDRVALLGALHGMYAPDKAVAAINPDAPEAARARIPWLAGKTTRAGAAAAYVCVDGACLAPVTSPEALEAALKQAYERARK